MSLDTTVAPSRRTLLGAAIGAAAATVAVTLERPLTAAAADGETIQVGGEYTSSSPTQITNQSNGQAAIVGIGSGSGLGVVGVSEAGYGVRGNSTSGRGVLADSSTGSGIEAVSVSGWGVSARSTSGPGVYGNSHESSGVAGYCGMAPPQHPARPHTGIFGTADPVLGSCGVAGVVTGGEGVRGEATSGIGGYFTAGSSGTALEVSGKAKFSRSKRVSIGAGKSSLKVTLAGVTTSSLVFAVLHSNRSGYYVRAVVPSSGYFTIYLNKATTSATYVAYFVVN